MQIIFVLNNATIQKYKKTSIGEAITTDKKAKIGRLQGIKKIIFNRYS